MLQTASVHVCMHACPRMCTEMVPALFYKLQVSVSPDADPPMACAAAQGIEKARHCKLPMHMWTSMGKQLKQ